MPEIRPSVSGDCEFAVGTVWGTLSGYALVFALDGNLELQGPTRLRLWESGTRGRGGRVLSMQTDGNLVIYDATRSTVLWASHTAGHQGAFLAVQEDGNVVIYSNKNIPIWATDTACETGAEKLPEIEILNRSAAAMPMRLAR
jgi:tricorn protease-like protein